jgi:hypothetical protein
MASEVEIVNRALSRVGATRITSLTENTVNARAANAVYATLRDAELRAHRWSFAIKRAQLAADATAPAFGPANAFPLPADFLKLLPPDPNQHLNDLDWRIEHHESAVCIMTDQAAPLNIRYIHRVTDPNKMDVLFREALSMRIAREVCEPLTQSNTKIQLIDVDYREAIATARKANAFERPSDTPPDDTWVTVRA